MANIVNVLVLVTFIFCLIEVGYSKRCFSCTTLKNKNCDDPFSLPISETVECNEHKYGCMKQILDKGTRIVHRGCTPNIYCTALLEHSEHCTVCDNDLCNSSTVLVPSVVLGLVVLFKLWF